jgi:hypothetical protein
MKRLGNRPVSAQRGQSLVMALGLLMAGAALMVAMFGTGQVTAAKQRLIGAADAAAWSTGLWRARVLNYHAYANRAIVANEVAIAQAVTLLAWSKYFETLTRNAASFATLFPPAEPVLTGVAEAALLARESAELAATLEVSARGARGVGYIEILQASQEILHLSTQGFGASMVAAEVVRATDRSYFAWVLPDAAGDWRSLTHRADEDADRRRFADLVVASLDPFVAGPRDEDLYTPIPSLCLRLMRLRKRGSTSLSDDMQQWVAHDTMSFHRRSLGGLRCRETETVPLGWGAVHAGEGFELPVALDAVNPQAEALADAASSRFPSYAGIARTRELDYEALGNARFPVTRLAVVARQPGAAVATAMARGLAAGRLLPADRFVGEGSPHLWAVSAAEVYFRRPVTAPTRVEYASLFNPYWQVRLAAPSEAQRAAALVHAH